MLRVPCVNVLDMFYTHDRKIVCHMTRLRLLCMRAHADCQFSQKAISKPSGPHNRCFQKQVKVLLKAHTVFNLTYNYDYLGAQRVCLAKFS